MITREQLVTEALTWVGTPFHHMARVKGVGADCVGVILGAAWAVGLEVWDVKRYARVPANGQFEAAVDAQTEAVELADVLPGDLMKFTWTTEPQHIAMVVSINPVRILHAYAQVGSCIVTDFDPMWQARFSGARRFMEFA